MADFRIPRANDDDSPIIPLGQHWDGVVNAIESGIEVISPLYKTEDPGGNVTIGVKIAASIIPLKLTAAETGSGLYTGFSLAGTTTADPGTDLSLPLNLTPAGTADLLVANPLESGASGHSLNPTTMKPIFGTGAIVGLSNETPPRRVVILCSGSADTRTGLKYQVDSIIDDAGTKAYDWTRAS